MIGTAMIAQVLLGDDTLLAMFSPQQCTAPLWTRERLRGVGAEVTRRMAAEKPTSTAEIERLFDIVLEEAMIELDVPGSPNETCRPADS
jgi:hypothetical protein